MKKLTALFLAVVMLLSVASAMADTLKMGTNAAFPPYEQLVLETGEIIGIDAEIAAAVCAKMGYDLEIIDMEFEALLSALESHKIDFSMAGMTVTPDRLEQVNFSNSYATGVQVIIVPEGSPIKSIEDLQAANPKIGVQLSTTGDLYSTWDFEDVGLGTVARFPNGNEAVMALKAGKIDCVMIDNEPAKNFVAGTEGLKILDTPYALEDYAAAFNKEDTELLDAFNAALAELTADGTVAAIIEKYIPAE